MNIEGSYLSNFNFLANKPTLSFVSALKVDFIYPATVDQIYLRKDTSATSISYAYIRLWKTPISIVQNFFNQGNFFFDNPTNMLFSYYDFRIHRQSATTINLYESLKEVITNSVLTITTGYDIDDSITVQCGKTTMIDDTKSYPDCIQTKILKSPSTGSISLNPPPGTIFAKSLNSIYEYTLETWVKFEGLTTTVKDFINPTYI